MHHREAEETALGKTSDQAQGSKLEASDCVSPGLMSRQRRGDELVVSS